MLSCLLYYYIAKSLSYFVGGDLLTNLATKKMLNQFSVM